MICPTRRPSSAVSSVDARLTRRQPVPRQCHPVETHTHRRNVRLRLQRHVHQPGNTLNRRHALGPQPPQHGQVGTEDLDGDVGARPRQHVIDAMRDGLPNGDVGARHQRQPLADLLQHNVLRPPPPASAARLSRWTRRPARCSSSSARPVPARRRRHLGHVQQQTLDGASQRVRLLQARARQRHRADDQRPLVERRQERTTHAGDCRQRHGEQQTGSDENQVRLPQHTGQQNARIRGGWRPPAPARDPPECAALPAEDMRTAPASPSAPPPATRPARSGRRAPAAAAGALPPPRERTAAGTPASRSASRRRWMPGSRGWPDRTTSSTGTPSGRRQSAAFSRRRLTTFSTSTIASSTSAPTAMAIPPQRHAVDRKPRQPHTDHRGEQRQRYRQQRDRAGPQIGQEHQRDEDHQQCAVAQRAVQVRQRQLDEVRLPERPGVELHARRQLRLDLVEHTVEGGGQRQRVDLRLPVDAEYHRRLPVAGAFAPF